MSASTAMAVSATLAVPCWAFFWTAPRICGASSPWPQPPPASWWATSQSRPFLASLDRGLGVTAGFQAILAPAPALLAGFSVAGVVSSSGVDLSVSVLDTGGGGWANPRAGPWAWLVYEARIKQAAAMTADALRNSDIGSLQGSGD
jgi:hypothetical protein